MNYLIAFSFMALAIERILELMDKVYRYFFPPDEKLLQAVYAKIETYKDRADDVKKTYREMLEKIKDKPLENEDFEKLMLLSQGYVNLSEEEAKDLVQLWAKYNKEQTRTTAIKTIVMWFLGIGLGLSFCLLTDHRIFGPLGVSALMPLEDAEGIRISVPWMDYILTSILLSSGTKPIHDLFSIISTKAKIKL